jgi:hypothetical protein
MFGLAESSFCVKVKVFSSGLNVLAVEALCLFLWLGAVVFNWRKVMWTLFHKPSYTSSTHNSAWQPHGQRGAWGAGQQIVLAERLFGMSRL